MEKKKLPQVVWEGWMEFCDIKLKVYVLDDGRRIIDADGYHEIIHMINDAFEEDDQMPNGGA